MMLRAIKHIPWQ